MKKIDAKDLVQKLRNYGGRPVRIMEVCGTQTHENYRLGIRSLLPKNIRLIAGPGCPVCVTPGDYIAMASRLARKKGVVICSFGDLIRVPGGGTSLANERARGADIRAVYSPLDAVEIAESNPAKQIVFLSVGFETTAPVSCLAVKEARKCGISNFSLLVACKTMTNAYRFLKNSTDAFLYPGHVSAITGMNVYRELLAEGISGAVSGFTALELLTAITVIVTKLQTGKPFAVNCYSRVVPDKGNPQAFSLIDEVMESCDAVWRGLGCVPDSGLRLRPEYSRYDAQKKFGIEKISCGDPVDCRCGDILRGVCEPGQCRHFGVDCKPETPVGACMVSGEGACSAQYKYGGVAEWMK